MSLRGSAVGVSRNSLAETCFEGGSSRDTTRVAFLSCPRFRNTSAGIVVPPACTILPPARSLSPPATSSSSPSPARTVNSGAQRISPLATVLRTNNNNNTPLRPPSSDIVAAGIPLYRAMGFAEDMVADAVSRQAAKAVKEHTSSVESVLSVVFGADSVENWKAKLAVLMAVVLVMVGAAAGDIATGGTLHKHGIYPRTAEGAYGVILAPFLHVSLSHLFVNALPFTLLGACVLLRQHGMAIFAYLSLTVTVLAGAVVWAFGEDHLHEGSSALVFGFFAYLLLTGALAREWRATVVALVAFLLYGTTLLSMFTQAMGPDAAYREGEPVSWMYMGAGAGAGAVFAIVENRLAASGLGFVAFVRRSVKDKEKGTAEERASLV